MASLCLYIKLYNCLISIMFMSLNSIENNIIVDVLCTSFCGAHNKEVSIHFPTTHGHA